MKKKLERIINIYGVIPQLKYFQSEVFELNEAILRNDEARKNYCEAYTTQNEYKYLTNHIAEEIADVMVILKQFQYHYGFTDQEILAIMDYKINRQIDRIEENK